MSPMPLRDALAVIRELRGPRDIVVPTMGAAREWMALGADHPLDFVLVPSSMGLAPSYGLGLALAKPSHRVVVLNGDGSMLMNLGSLVTITAEAPANLVVVVGDNGIYEVTGAQPVPAAAAGRRGADPLDFAAIAAACGFKTVFRFGDLAAWRAGAAGALAAPGPVFVVLGIEGSAAAGGPRSPGPAPARARRFMTALAESA